MQVDELKRELKKLKLPTTGNKEVLKQKLIDALAKVPTMQSDDGVTAALPAGEPSAKKQRTEEAMGEMPQQAGAAEAAMKHVVQAMTEQQVCFHPPP